MTKPFFAFKNFMNKTIYQLKRNMPFIKEILLIVFLIAVAAGSAFAQTKSSNQSQIEGTNVVVKIVDVKDNAVAGNEFIKPDAGNKFLSVQIVVDNAKGKSEWAVKPDNFNLKDSEGNIYKPNFLMDVTQPTLKSGKVDGGDLVKGWVTFQVGEKVDINSLKIRYEESGFVSDKTIKSGWINLSTAGK